MQKINFKNLPDTSTPLNASTLNQMQDNIETAINAIELMGGGDEVGTVKMFSGSTAPQGWLICDGSAISRTEYAELFSAIGTTYGSGNGTTTFNIPNIKGRTVVGLDSNDTDFNTLGNTLGEKTHTLTKQELPQIDIKTNYASGSGGSGNGLVYGTKTGESNNILVQNINNSGQPHNIIQPSIVLNYIIKASATTTTQGQIIDSLSGDSTTDAPSVHAVNEKIDSLNVYSTTERIVGKWIDGKPLYQRTIVYNNSTGLPSGNPSITHGISNIGSYRSVVRQSYIYDGNTYTGVSTSGSIVGVISIEPTVIYVSVSSNFANLFKLAYITLEYTKTTD